MPAHGATEQHAGLGGASARLAQREDLTLPREMLDVSAEAQTKRLRLGEMAHACLVVGQSSNPAQESSNRVSYAPSRRCQYGYPAVIRRNDARQHPDARANR